MQNALIKLNNPNLDPTHVAGHEMLMLAKELNAEILDMRGAYEDTLAFYDNVFVVNGPVVSLDEEYSKCCSTALVGAQAKIYFIYTDSALIPMKEHLPVDFICLSQGQNTEAVTALLRERGLLCMSSTYCSFEKMELLNNEAYKKKSDTKLLYDIVYGGSARYGKRKERFDEFFGKLSKDFSCAMCGSITQDDFAQESTCQIKFLGKARGRDGYLDMMHSARSTVCLFDPLHIELGMVTQRVYEAVLTDTVAFYDAVFPIQIFGNTRLDDFLRVINTKELNCCLESIKDDKLYNFIIKEQRKLIGEHKNVLRALGL